MNALVVHSEFCMLKADVFDRGQVTHPEVGTPQDDVLSPLLANIYLHEVLDVRFEDVVTPRLKGQAFLIRYADDVIIVCGREDLEKYRKALLDEEMTAIIQETAAEVADRFPIEMEAIGMDKNHIHLLCSAYPKMAPRRIVQMMKLPAACCGELHHARRTRLRLTAAVQQGLLVLARSTVLALTPA
ncbi:MAG: transposase [Nitrospira sp.]|nr:transposase [Nitrospira sp.]